MHWLSAAGNPIAAVSALPDATTITTPACAAYWHAWSSGVELEEDVRLMLIILAPWSAAHLTPDATTSVVPKPESFSTRTASSCASDQPAIPSLLSRVAAIIPATCVPWNDSEMPGLSGRGSLSLPMKS